MPPVNATRRDLLADAAIAVLAADGARGLTHRAVDAVAAVPPGTTSRYFRTRDALFRAVVHRASELHFAELRQLPDGPVDRAGVAAHLAGVVRLALTEHRARHLAMCELFLESTRRPALREVMSRTRAEQLRWLRHVYRAAQVELTDPQVALLASSLTGLAFVALTTPEPFGLDSLNEIDTLVQTLARVPETHQVPSAI